MVSIISAFALSFIAFAQTPPKKEVIFFGGHGASKDDMVKWVSAASQSIPYKDYFKFRAIEFKAKSWDRKTSMSQNLQAVQDIANEINNDTTGREFILVGHSSGSASTFKIAAKIRPEKCGQVKVIDLDGFTPREVPGCIETACWTARDAKTAVGTENSTNMERCRNSTTIRPFNCKSNANCLHNSLVNVAAPDVTGANYYRKLNPNLMWLNKSLPESASAAVQDVEAVR